MQQEKALALLKSGKNVFLTGSAGTGKTYVLNQYITYLKKRRIPVAITASTGIAATHMNGMTIHSWAGFGIKEQLTRANLNSMKEKKYLKEHLENAKILIIDEISMLHKKQLDMVDTVLQFFKENDEPFGDIQVVVCGDFFQLPPIGNQNEKSKDKFAFMSAAWVAAKFNVCYLTEQYRQANEDVLNTILNEIRIGKISKESIAQLKKAEKNTFSDDDEPTKLFTHNYDVDQINTQHLQQLKGKVKRYTATTKGNKKLVETLKKSVLAKEELELKMHTKVMFVRNNQEQGYVNGTLGTIVSFNDDGFPVVKTAQGKRISVKQENWGVHDDTGKVLASLDQIPLRLAWAITVHKCQGMTLDGALIDLSKTFEKGQGYVALSRLKNIENLKLLGFNEMALQVDGLAHKADKRFLELSTEADQKYVLNNLEEEAIKFVVDCGGLTNLKAIEKHAKKIIDKKVQSDSTYDVTLDYFRKKLTLEEIADQRGLSTGTIAGHLIKLCKDYPEEDFSFYQPKEQIIKDVEKAKNKQKKGAPVSLKSIFETLNKKVAYNDIKLALAFIGRE
ncbi:AAA family ATPase [Cellulophaga sp. 20_2_10]|uniref:helix-turn-helix domain-containing protein n=1 Tax=Cellulophaga sp. 20_2_10 TaxID=2942476 RepID=UPI00201AA9C1|nr:helix-turn-helix domain-containing protein [Cellulophaga sp. 20_2_10]MCL5247225.1 AAA family ATPase [Cellulophaga sp. 20_2_10]